MKYGWYGDAQPQEKGWRSAGRLVDEKGGEVWVALGEPGGAKTDAVTLGGRLTLINAWGGNTPLMVDKAWSVQADIPAPSVERMQDWWEKNTAGRNAQWYGLHPAATQAAERPVQQWLREAQKLTGAKRIEEAIAVYRKIVNAPDDQWPEWYGAAFNGPTFLADARRRTEVCLVRLLAEAGKWDNAQEELAKLRGTVTGKGDPLNVADTRSRAIVRDGELAYVRALLAKGRLAEAQAMLDDVSKGRPDLAAIPDREVNVVAGQMASYVNLRQVQREAWRRV